MVGTRREPERGGVVGDDPMDELYRDRYPTMVRLAVMLVDQRELAEDIVQDAFAATFRQRDRVANPAAYLRAAVVNACRDEQRARARARRRVSDPPRADQGEPDYLRDVIQTLPDRQRTAVILRFYEDLPFDEIAAAMGLRPSTARVLVRRALAKLRRVVEP